MYILYICIIYIICYIYFYITVSVAVAVIAGVWAAVIDVVPAAAIEKDQLISEEKLSPEKEKVVPEKEKAKVVPEPLGALKEEEEVSMNNQSADHNKTSSSAATV